MHQISWRSVHEEGRGSRSDSGSPGQGVARLMREAGWPCSRYQAPVSFDHFCPSPNDICQRKGEFHVGALFRGVGEWRLGTKGLQGGWQPALGVLSFQLAEHGSKRKTAGRAECPVDRRGHQAGSRQQAARKQPWCGHPSAKGWLAVKERSIVTTFACQFVRQDA